MWSASIQPRVKPSWKHLIFTSNYRYIHTGVPYNTAYGLNRPYVNAQCSMFTYKCKSKEYSECPVELYGVYASDILEGRQDNDAQNDVDTSKDNRF